MNSNVGKTWTREEEDKMISILAQTRMSSADCDTVFSRMFERTPRAIYIRRVLIAQKMLKTGHQLSYICMLLHLTEDDIVPPPQLI
jgi:hypothetical protein